jgi:PST family polysaccharide transporter
MVDLARAGARGALVTVLSQAVRFVLRFGSVVVLARLLTPQDFGLVAMATTVAGIAEIIRDFGLSSAAIQSRSLSDQERTNLFWINVGIGAGCGALAVAGSAAIADFYGDPRVRPIVLALAGLMVVSGANTQFRAELSRSLAFRALAVTDVVAQLLGVSVAVLAAALGAGYWAIVLQQVTLVIATCAINVAQCSWRPRWYARAVSVRRFVRYGGGVVGTQAIGYATNNVDNLAIGAVWGTGPLGLYSRAYQLLLVPLEQLNTAMTAVVLSVLSKVRDDRARFERYLATVQLLNSSLVGTGFAVAAGLCVPLVAVIFGPGWHGVAPIFALLAVGGVFRALTQVVYWTFLALGLTGRQLKVYLVTRPFMIGLILAGLPWGPVGVAAGHSVAFLLYWMVSLWQLGRAAGMDVRPLFAQAIRSLGIITIPAALAAFAGTLAFHNTAASLLTGAGAAAAYIGLATSVSRRHRGEARVIAGIIRRSVTRSAVVA